LTSIPHPLIILVDKAFTSRPARDSENGPQIAFFARLGSAGGGERRFIN